MRKTKIICTLGPATDDEKVLRALCLSGMDAARFNFSHSNHDEHRKRLAQLIALRKEMNLPIAAILDTRGPEIRIGSFKKPPVMLSKGQQFTLTTQLCVGDERRVHVNYPGLPMDLSSGMTVLIDDGLVSLKVEEVGDTEIVCRVQNDGILSDNKGVNVPNTPLSLPFISRKDREDILFGIEEGFDFIAASFTRSAADVLEIRRILDEKNCHNINIIAKIENREGVDNIDEIISVSDAIMVARGDMGVEIPLEELPAIQKMLIKKVTSAGRQVITATQMLESMMKNPRPTRAEATDVANAIYDGTSAIMLSGETAAGQYPVEALQTMVRIAMRTESAINYIRQFKTRDVEPNPDVTNAISHAGCTTAHDLRAAAIVAVSKTGKTVRMISKYRPNCTIIGCSPYKQVCRQLNLSWGVVPLLVPMETSTDDLIDSAVGIAERAGLVSLGEMVVITAGVPIGVSGTTNLMKVHVVGHVLVSGDGITEKTVVASLCVCQSEEEALMKFKEGEILAIHSTSNATLPILRKAAGIIVEQGGTNSHAAIVGLSLDIPVITGAENATKILRSGAVVTMDAARGTVYCNQCSY